MLFIGSVQGGPEVATALVGKAESRLMNVVDQVVGDFAIGSTSALNIVFHIPGSMAPNVGYDGLRDGKFSREEKLLTIQVAVPKEIAVCDDEETILNFLFDSLRKANRIAAKYFKKKGMEYSQPKYLGLVDAVEHQMRQQA
jgi:hypothetical protein